MKRILFIIVLFSSVYSFGQDLSYYIKSQGRWVKFNGSYLRYTQSQYDPVVPVDSINVFWSSNFDTWAAQDGIQNDTFQNYWGTGANVQSEYTSAAVNMAIESYDGSMAIRSDYDAGQCCYTTCATGNGGTGGHVEEQLDSALAECYLSFNIWIPSDYAQPDDHKLPGLRTGDYLVIGDAGCLARLVLRDRSAYGGTHAEVWYYIYDYYNNPYANDPPRLYDANIDLTRGDWNNITFRVYSGSTDSYNGIFETYHNGTFTSTRTCKWKSSYGYTYDWDTFTFQTFAGGCDELWFPTYMYNYIDDLVIFNYSENVSVPKGDQPSAPGREINFPAEANWPR